MGESTQDMKASHQTNQSKNNELQGEPTNRGQDTAASENRQQQSPVSRHRVDPKLLELLVCPLTKASLDFNAATGELISRQARLAYPIRDGIPIMLPDQARPLTDDE